MDNWSTSNSRAHKRVTPVSAHEEKLHSKKSRKASSAKMDTYQENPNTTPHRESDAAMIDPCNDCERKSEMEELLSMHGLHSFEGKACDFSSNAPQSNAEYNLYKRTLEMLEDWLSPDLTYIHLMEVSALVNCSHITILLESQGHVGNTKTHLGDVQKAAVLRHIEPREPICKYTMDFINSIDASKVTEITSYILRHIPDILQSLLFDMMLDASRLSGKDVIKCLIHILASIVAVFGCAVHLLSEISKIVSSQEMEGIINDLPHYTKTEKSAMEYLLTNAVRCGNDELVKTFLDYSSDDSKLPCVSEICDAQTGDTLLHIAARLGQLTPEWIVGDTAEQLRLYFLLRDKPILGSCREHALTICYLSFIETPSWLDMLSEDTSFHFPHFFRIHLLLNIHCDNYCAVADALIKHGCDVNATNGKKETPLHVVSTVNAVANGIFLKILDIAVNFGSSVQFGSDLSITKQSVCPIVVTNRKTYIIDSQLFHKIFVRMLSRWPADEDDVDNISDRSTEAESMNQSSKCLVESFANLLIKNGADVERKTSSGLTPSDVALREVATWYDLFRWNCTDKDRIMFASVETPFSPTKVQSNDSPFNINASVRTCKLFSNEVSCETFRKHKSVLLYDLCKTPTIKHRQVERDILTTSLYPELHSREKYENNSISETWVKMSVTELAIAFVLHEKAKKEDFVMEQIKFLTRLTTFHGWPEFIISVLATCLETNALRKHQNIPLNAINNNGETALHIAAKNDDLILVKLLIEHGADINKLDANGCSPLIAALKNTAEDTALEIFSEHIKQGTNCLNRCQLITPCNVRGQTMLHVFSERNDIVAVENLIKLGIDVGVLDNEGCSPLVTALTSSSWESAALIMNSSADALKISRLDVTVQGGGQTIFHVLNPEDLPDDLTRLLYHNESSIQFASFTDFNGNTPVHYNLYWAVKTNDYSQVNRQNDKGETPLHRAFENDSVKFVEDVIKHGADITITDAMFNTPLHGSKITAEAIRSLTHVLMSMNSHVDQLNIFGEHSALYWLHQQSSALTEYTDHLGNTKLHVAAGTYSYCGLDHNKKFFVAASDDAQYSLRNNFGQTPVHVHFLASGLNTLLTKNVFRNVINVEDGRGRTVWHHVFLFDAFHHLTDYVHRQSRVRLYDSNKKLVPQSTSSDLCRNAQLNKRIYGFDKVDSQGRAPLHYAAMKSGECRQCHHEGCLLYCKCCLNFFGVDSLRIKDRYGRTPFHYAYMNGYVPSKDICCLIPADVLNEDAPDHFGYSPKQLFERRLDKRSQSEDPCLLKLMKSIGSVCSQQFPSEGTTAYLDEAMHRTQSAGINAWELWNVFLRNGLYSDQQKTLSAEVYRATTAFVTKIVDAIGQEDPRLRGRLLQVGSSFEGTRIDPSYEYDFNVVLELSEVCEVSSTHDALPGFVALRQRSDASTSRLATYDTFFDKDGNLECKKLNFTFQSTMIKVLSSQKFWEDEDVFYLCHYEHFYEITPQKHCKHLLVRFNQLLLGQYLYDEVSIDIVPVIHIPNYWPDGGRDVDDDIKFEGCNFVFDQPYRDYQIPYSPVQYVKISFARAESLLMRTSSPLLQAAYIVSKGIWMHCNQPRVISHILKMAALWSLLNSDSTYSELTEVNLQRQVTILLEWLYKFSVQDFVPCYFLPNFHFPVWKFEPFVYYSRVFLRSILMSYEKLFTVSSENSDFMLDYDNIKRSLVCSYLLYISAARSSSDPFRRLDWIWPQLDL